MKQSQHMPSVRTGFGRIYRPSHVDLDNITCEVGANVLTAHMGNSSEEFSRIPECPSWDLYMRA